MGNACGEQIYDDTNQDVFSFMMGVDNKETKVRHSERISCSNQESQLQQKGLLYRDPLLKTDQIILKSETSEVKCTYQRPYKILHLPPQTPYNLLQQKEGSPTYIVVKAMQYFGTFLCFMAENPKLVQEIILTKQNTFGLHVVKTVVKGKEQDMLIDDLILCHKNKPIFSQPYKDTFMWPCILEKAWLKLKGYLRKVVKTSPEQVFESFLNLPTQRIFLEGQQDQKILEKIRKYLYQNENKNGLIITTKEKPKHKIGLSDRQNLYFIRSFDHEGRRIFYFRNPCGKFDFRGIYSGVPLQVEKKVKQLQKINSIPEGNFLLDQQELFQQISQITIIHNIPNIKISTTNLTFQPNNQFFIEFQIQKEGPFCLCLTQYPPPESKQFPTLESYCPLTYHLVNLRQNKIVGGMQNQQACFGIKTTYFLNDVVQNVTPGKYLLRLKKKIKVNSMYNNQCLLVGYFSGLSKAKNFKQTQLVFNYNNQLQMSQKFEEFLKQLIKKQMNQANESPIKKYANQDSFDSRICWVGDLVVIYIEKRKLKTDDPIMIQVSFPDLKNLQCITHDLKKGQYKSYELKDKIMFIFQKIDLTEETSIQKYTIQGY